VTRRYKAFISYSWADKAWGEWLHRTLETYRAPKGVADGRSLHPIFKDREEEAAGGSVGAAIEAALAASEFLIVICSPRSARSTWVNREVAWFKTHKDKGRILALIVDGEPGAGATPGREGEECFPKTLTHKVGADLQPTEEWEDAPLAADARAEGDGRRGAKLKLAAALLGVGLDALVRRDERRRTIRRRFVTSAAFGLATVLGGLAIYAFTQRDAAVVARNEAVMARDDAEEIIELILTDLKSDLEGFGTLKSVTTIGNRAIGYYEGQNVKALTPDQLGRRARVLLMLGEADNKRGDLTAALARYESAATTTSEQLARDPDNAQRIFDHAQSVFWVGYIAWQRGEHAKAREQFTEYHRHATRLVEIDPQNDDWQAELEYAYSNLGTLAMEESDAAAAENWFRKSLEKSAASYAASGGAIQIAADYGQSHAWLADAVFHQGRLAESRQLREDEISIYRRALSVEAAHAPTIGKLVAAQCSLAIIKVGLGEISGALADARNAVSAARALLDDDSANLDYMELLSFALSIEAESLMHSENWAGAAAAADDSLELARLLSQSDDAPSDWTEKFLAQPMLLKARILASQGHSIAAAKVYEQIAEALRAPVLERGADENTKRRYAAALAGLAQNVVDDARWSEIIRVLEGGKNLKPESAIILAEAYLRRGKRPRAEEIVSRLKALGYRHPDFIKLLANSNIDVATDEKAVATPVAARTEELR
jgi:tetratricopeptide (TPR) repeat protein